MLEHASGMASFFQAMAPVLIANVLTVAFVYSFVKIHQKELDGKEESRLAYLWLIVMVFLKLGRLRADVRSEIRSGHCTGPFRCQLRARAAQVTTFLEDRISASEFMTKLAGEPS
jgi:hypothetical protein